MVPNSASGTPLEAGVRICPKLSGQPAILILPGLHFNPKTAIGRTDGVIRRAAGAKRRRRRTAAKGAAGGLGECGPGAECGRASACGHRHPPLSDPRCAGPSDKAPEAMPARRGKNEPARPALLGEFRRSHSQLRFSGPMSRAPAAGGAISSQAARPPPERASRRTAQPCVAASWRTIASPRPEPPVSTLREASSR